MKSFTMCPKCGGDAKICCGNGTHLLKKEALIIEKELGRKIKLKKTNEKGLYQIDGDGRCQFLSKTGCTLKHKPISCYLYPFLPTKKGWVMRLNCKYWWTITKKDFEDVKRFYAKNKRLWKNK